MKIRESFMEIRVEKKLTDVIQKNGQRLKHLAEV